ncbi:hypothetical protein [Streptomyces albicerus]|uniref:hypothetical protein n=1 Tax=Streptomyces albicerus TaxID=2569859 RepID=UPI00124AFFE8|nr:hypothetical protein [Streptomyces albicerus]
MTTETTEVPREAFGSQLAALRAAVALADQFPQFEPAYLTFSQHYPDQVNIQAESFVALEAWREALGAAPVLVHSREIGPDVELYFEAPAFGATIRVYAMGLVVSDATAVAA